MTVDAAAVIAAAHPYALAGHSYPTPLPPELSPWYLYSADGGHSIVILLPETSYPRTSGNLAEYTVPAPVKTVLRLGWTIDSNGYVVSDVPYDDLTGLTCDPDDGEF